jgi:uncharacterized membrane protein YhaH (DUF805 family)
MVDLLFNPQGRISAGAYWQGAIILLVLFLLLNAVSTYGPVSIPLSLVLFVIEIVLVYSIVCVNGKRLHDAGKSAWWSLAIIIAALVLQVIASSLVQRLLFAEQTAALQQQMQASMRGGANVAVILQGVKQTQKVVFVPTIAILTVVTLALSFLVASLKSDPGENRFGEPAAA